MKPEEKEARRLVDMFFTDIGMSLEKAKQCALIVVEEIIKSTPTDPHLPNSHEEVSEWSEDAITYWLKVKEAINKLQ